MFEQFQQLPKGMKLIMGGLASACLLAVAWMFDLRAFWIVLIGLVLVALAIFLWILYQNWKSRQRAKALSGSLSANSSAAPSSISDPASRAKLDALRQNFGKGLEKFRSAGKDIYSLPWYVVCGEPGSGKTEAVRHCNVGFPPGLQDEMQGAGGTLNMHWWFTNQAVLLDTAGKLLFQEAPPGSTSEWNEFLKLLKKTRPNCPINGLLLVIPSESLIKDQFEDIQRKAGKIAQQLDTIQRTLDVRFPVFILITKCDLINGFREFFSGVKDPQLQHQMTGWSNPQPLDTPFRPDEVDQHLQEVVRRVSRRRLGLMRDPVPADPGKRRVDEVDALFTLPASIGALGPRLRKYLETIFVAGEWSAKPLFLRGIYFTSALTEGSALDAELASVLGVPMDQLPEGKAWERERSFFLRDLFVQKIFKEKGLVTRATNTRKLLRRRQWILGSVVGVGLATLVIVSVLARSALRTSVGEELTYWKVGVQPDNWSGGRWRPVVNSGLEYTGNDLLQLDGGREWSLLEFHEKLQQRVATDMNVPWVFKPVESLAVRANSSRKRAQRVLFEAGVVAPIVDANRDRLTNLDQWTPADAERLAALVQLEGAIHLRGQSGYVEDYPAEDFFNPLFRPALAKVPDGAAVLDRMIHVFDWTYFRGGAGRGQWPSAWLARGQTLRDNQPLQRGWESLEKSVQSAQTTQREAFSAIQTGRLTVVRFIEAEKVFLKAASQSRNNSNWKSSVDAAWTELAARRAAVDALVTDLQARTGVTGEVTLDAAYRAAVDRVRGEGARASKRIREAMLKQRAAAETVAKATSGPATEFTLYRDVERRLNALDNQLTAQLDQLLPPAEQGQLADLDAQSLRGVGGGAPGYILRGDLYAEAMRIISPLYGDGVSLLGRLGETVGEQAKSLVALRERFAKFAGAPRPDFPTGVQNLIDAAAALGVDATLAAYQRELDAEFAPTTGFPLGQGAPLTGAQLRTKLALLERARSDFASANVPAEARRVLEARGARVDQLYAFTSALVGADGEPQTVRLQLIKDADQPVTIDKAIGAASGVRQGVARVFPSLRVNGKAYRQRGLAANTDIDKPTVAARLPKLEFSTTPDPKPVPDAVVDRADTWGLLRLLQQGSVRRADGKEWDGVIRFQDSGIEMVLAVTVVFDKPLPPLDRWPTAAK